MRRWRHSGISVDHRVTLAAGDTAGLERLAQYMLRCPFSLARMIRVTGDGQAQPNGRRGSLGATGQSHGEKLAMPGCGTGLSAGLKLCGKSFYAIILDVEDSCSPV